MNLKPYKTPELEVMPCEAETDFCAGSENTGTVPGMDDGGGDPDPFEPDAKQFTGDFDDFQSQDWGTVWGTNKVGESQ